MREFGADAETALCVAWHESRLQVDAVNPVSGTLGAMQIHPEWADEMASIGLSIDEPADRIEFARWLQQMDGWSVHWVQAARECGV